METGKHLPESASKSEVIRVLVIEDNKDDAYLFQQRLKTIDFDKQVHFLEDGLSAQEYIDKNIKGLQESLIGIFLDLRLPGIPGLNILKHMRENNILADVPIFIMTSSNDPKDLEECKRLKATKFITKPITLAKFSEALADMFHK